MNATPEGPPPPSLGRRILRHLWPDTIFARLAFILIVGMLAVQFLTSSVWLSVRYAQMLEVPTRVTAERVADVVSLLERGADSAAVTALAREVGLEFTRAEAPGKLQPLDSDHDRTVSRLLDRAFHERLPHAGRLQLTSLSLLDENGHEATWRTFLGFGRLTVEYGLQVEKAPGRWLQFHTSVHPGWQEGNGWQVLGDLLWRVYLLRILVVVLLVMLAVRWVVEPLGRLARAAQAMEHDVRTAPPLEEKGLLEVRNAARSFNRMQARIVDALDERTRFLAAVSHDLRSPLARMRLRLALLDEGSDLADIKARLGSDITKMEDLTAAILSFIRAGQEHTGVQQINLDSLVRSACQDLQDLGHDVQVEGHIDGTLEGYSLSLRRVVENLLENALRYGHRASVTLSGTLEQVEICIVDDGPGVPPNMLDSITQPFVRCESSRNLNTGGHGLGLSIVNAIVGSHHGQLILRNAPPRGLEVRVILPRVQQAPVRVG